MTKNENLIKLFILPAFPWHFEKEISQKRNFLQKSRGKAFSPSAKLPKLTKKTKNQPKGFDVQNKLIYFSKVPMQPLFLAIFQTFFAKLPTARPILDLQSGAASWWL